MQAVANDPVEHVRLPVQRICAISVAPCITTRSSAPRPGVTATVLRVQRPELHRLRDEALGAGLDPDDRLVGRVAHDGLHRQHDALDALARLRRTRVTGWPMASGSACTGLVGAHAKVSGSTPSRRLRAAPSSSQRPRRARPRSVAPPMRAAGRRRRRSPRPAGAPGRRSRTALRARRPPGRRPRRRARSRPTPARRSASRRHRPPPIAALALRQARGLARRPRSPCAAPCLRAPSSRGTRCSASAAAPRSSASCACWLPSGVGLGVAAHVGQHLARAPPGRRRAGRAGRARCGRRARLHAAAGVRVHQDPGRQLDRRGGLRLRRDDGAHAHAPLRRAWAGRRCRPAGARAVGVDGRRRVEVLAARSVRAGPSHHR